jgi:hypothetical protein
MLGGLLSSGITGVTTIDKIIFATDATQALTSKLTVGKLGAGTFNSNLVGYSTGSYASSTYGSTIDRLTFSNESNVVLAATLTSNRGAAPGFENI